VKLFKSLFKKQSFKSTPLTPGASTRQYFRITGEPAAQLGCASLILAQYSKKETVSFNNYRAATHFLISKKFKVPQILKVVKQEKILLMEDLGSRSLLQLTKKVSTKEKETHYKKVLQNLAAFHKLNVKNTPLFKKKYDRPGTLVPYNKIFISIRFFFPYPSIII